MPSVSLKDIVEKFGGQLHGEDVQVSKVASIQSAKPGDIAFIDNDKYKQYLEVTAASAVIIPANLQPMAKQPAILTDNPKLLYAKVARLLNPKPSFELGVHPTAVVADDVYLGEGISIGPFCVIGKGSKIENGVILESHCVVGSQCQVGEHSHLHARVTLYSNVHLGASCEIHSGSVIGADGFGYANDRGRWVKVPQIGGVRIGNFVEIGANTTIDSGAIEPTQVDDGAILDNLIQIGHNVKVGKHTAMSAQVGIAGSTSIGNYCMIGGASIINGHIKIADGTIFIPGSQVANSIKKPEVVASAIPAKPRAQWAKNVARFHRLDDMATKMNQLQRRVNQLEQSLEESGS